MSDSVLRSVSPMHVEYLQNMGVHATMTVSLMVEDKLWGLVACHNYSDKYISSELRGSSLLLSHFFSNRINSQIKISNQEKMIHFQKIREELINQVQNQDNTKSGLFDDELTLMDYIPCDGVAFIFDNEIYTKGITPGADQIYKLLPLVDEFMSYNDLFATESLANYGQEYTKLKDVASGILAVSVPYKYRIMTIFFRKEVIQTVTWSGDPHKPITWDGKDIPRLHPRKSFDEWKEVVKYHSLPWIDLEMEAAIDCMSALSRFFLKRSEIMEGLIHEISLVKKKEEDALQKLSEKDTLIKEIHHRVKNNLQIIVSLLNLQGSFLSDPKIVQALQESQSRIQSMAMVHDLLYHDNNLQTVDLHKYINQLANHVSTIYKSTKKNIWIEIDVASVNFNINQLIPLGLILNELIMNSFKYAFPDSKEANFHSSGKRSLPEKKGEMIQINIQKNPDSYKLNFRDTGIGYPPNYPDPHPKSLGTLLIQSLSKQLHGSPRFWNDNGANFELVFPY